MISDISDPSFDIAVISQAIQMFGSDEEGFLENVQFQNSCAFAMIQIGEKVKRLSAHLTLKHWYRMERDREIQRYAVAQL